MQLFSRLTTNRDIHKELKIMPSYKSINSVTIALTFLGLALLGSQTLTTAVAAEPEEITKTLAPLVQDLTSEDLKTRDAAEKGILTLSEKEKGKFRQQVLNDLPKLSDQMPVDLRHRLARLQKTIESARSEAAVAGTTVTLEVKNEPLSKVLAEITKQTGNRFVNQFGGAAENEAMLLEEDAKADPVAKPAAQQSKEPKVTLSLKHVPFWKALDILLDQTNTDLNTFSGDDSIVVINRRSKRTPRTKGTSYHGPFRITVKDVYARRNLVRPEQNTLRVAVEMSWEPRLQPIRISLPMNSVSAKDGKSNPLAITNAEAEFEASIQPGSKEAELQIALALPKRSVETISSLQGKFTALVPGEAEILSFDKLAKAVNVKQKRGGLVVTLERVRKNNDIWEVHMNLRFGEASKAFASHMGWVYENTTYLLDGKKEIEHIGYEVTQQTEEEIGIAYLFELPEGKKDLTGLKWVYKTPSAMVLKEVPFELKAIPLP